MSIIEGEQQAAPVSVTVEVGGKEITFETGKLAKQEVATINGGWKFERAPAAGNGVDLRSNLHSPTHEVEDR